MEKMNIKSIAIYANKSGRSNSKWTDQEWKKFDDDKFTIDDIYAMISWINNQPYKHTYDIIVYQNSRPVITLSAKSNDYQHSIEYIINKLYDFTSFINYEKYPITLSELHNDSNIRYLINQYYGGTK